uniref:FLYWCH-type domain-containing protein n=1 Tax=Acrobeloides nanus TaxID=290746 RepID=A0A914D1S9_9BILA
MDNKLEVYNTGGKSKSGHGGKMAYFRGFGYTFCNSWQTMNNENRLRWRCNYLNGKSCNAAIVTNDQFESNPELTASQVIDRVRNNVNAAVLDKFPSKNAQAISIQRSRKKVIDAPVNPTEINDLGEIPEEFSFRNKRDSFGGANVREKWLQSDNGFGNDRFLIFARPKFLRKLSASDQWFMDGTFGILPEVFGDNAQLLTIHARYQNSHHTIPCAYVVMQDKRQDTYERVFADLGLQGVIDGNVEMNLQYAMIKALAFVPENELDATYLDLVQNKLNRQVLDPFLDYLEENYIGKLDQRTGIRGDGLYPRKIWNVYARTLLSM